MQDDEWRQGRECEKTSNSNQVDCKCSEMAIYSARHISHVDKVQLLDLHKIYLNGPSVILLYYVVLLITLFLYYFYWAFFADRRERECYQTHIVHKMYNPYSPEQFLVCISTGGMPGSGTDGRVGFLLIGQSGSLQFVVPEGQIVYATGSEIWTAVSSDLIIGHVTGINVVLDKVRGGAPPNPWLLKRVIVYSMRYNHVITFEANIVLGMQFKSKTLPALPRNMDWSKEISMRFWRSLKRFHILGSVFMIVPGMGPSRCLSALASLTVILAVSAHAVEVLGPPSPVEHTTVAGPLDWETYVSSVVSLCWFMGLANVLVRSVYSLIFRRKVGVIWNDGPPQKEGEWKGGFPTERVSLSSTQFERSVELPGSEDPFSQHSKKSMLKLMNGARQSRKFSITAWQKTRTVSFAGTDKENVTLDETHSKDSKTPTRSSVSVPIRKEYNFRSESDNSSRNPQRRYPVLPNPTKRESTVISSALHQPVITSVSQIYDDSQNPPFAFGEFHRKNMFKDLYEDTGKSFIDYNYKGIPLQKNISADIYTVLEGRTEPQQQNTSDAINVSELSRVPLQSTSGAGQRTAILQASLARLSASHGSIDDMLGSTRKETGLRSPRLTPILRAEEGKIAKSFPYAAPVPCGMNRPLMTQTEGSRTDPFVYPSKRKPRVTLSDIISSADYKLWQENSNEGTSVDPPAPHLGSVSGSHVTSVCSRRSKHSHPDYPDTKAASYASHVLVRDQYGSFNVTSRRPSRHHMHRRRPFFRFYKQAQRNKRNSPVETPKYFQKMINWTCCKWLKDNVFQTTVFEDEEREIDTMQHIQMEPKEERVLHRASTNYRGLHARTLQRMNEHAVPFHERRYFKHLEGSKSKDHLSDSGGKAEASSRQHEEKNVRHVNRWRVLGHLISWVGAPSVDSKPDDTVDPVQYDTNVNRRPEDMEDVKKRSQTFSQIDEELSEDSSDSDASPPTVRLNNPDNIGSVGCRSPQDIAGTSLSGFQIYQTEPSVKLDDKKASASVETDLQAKIASALSPSKKYEDGRATGEEILNKSMVETTLRDWKTNFHKEIPGCFPRQSVCPEISNPQVPYSGSLHVPNKARRPRVTSSQHTYFSGVKAKDRLRPTDEKKMFLLCESLGRKTEHFSETSKPLSNMRSFRQFYYYPVVDCRSDGVYRISPDRNLRKPMFLRKSHYMEKMAKEYGLLDHREPEQQASGSSSMRNQVGSYSESSSSKKPFVGMKRRGTRAAFLSRASMELCNNDLLDRSNLVNTNNRLPPTACRPKKRPHNHNHGPNSSFRMGNLLQAAIHRVRLPCCAVCVCLRESLSESTQCCCCCGQVSQPETPCTHLEYDKNSLQNQASRKVLNDASAGPGIDKIKNFLSTCRAVVDHENTDVDLDMFSQILRERQEMNITENTLHTKGHCTTLSVSPARQRRPSETNVNSEMEIILCKDNVSNKVSGQGLSHSISPELRGADTEPSDADPCHFSADHHRNAQVNGPIKTDLDHTRLTTGDLDHTRLMSGGLDYTGLTFGASDHTTLTSADLDYTRPNPSSPTWPHLDRNMSGSRTSNSGVETVVRSEVSQSSANWGWSIGLDKSDELGSGKSAEDLFEPGKDRMSKETSKAQSTDSRFPSMQHAWMLHTFLEHWGMEPSTILVVLGCLKTCVVALSTAISIFCAGWVILNGYYYSRQESKNWVIIMVSTLVFEPFVVEPLVLLLLAFVSTNIWHRSLFISQSTERFSALIQDIEKREAMAEMGMTSEHMTGFIHKQALEDSPALYYLHHNIHKALKNVLGVPKIVFRKAVYWLLTYTALTIISARLQMDTSNCYNQNFYLSSTFGFSIIEETITVGRIWEQINDRIMNNLRNMEDHINIPGREQESIPRPVLDFTNTHMLISPIRMRQFRVRPDRSLQGTEACWHIPRVTLDPERWCNLNLNEENIESRHFGDSWNKPNLQGRKKYYQPTIDKEFEYGSLHEVPPEGYEVILAHNLKSSQADLDDIIGSHWVDVHTRSLIMDFTVINTHTQIISTFRVIFDFRRSAPFWHVDSYHLWYDQSGNTHHFMILVAILFFVLTVQNMFKESHALYRLGFTAYSKRWYTYVELFKVLLLILQGYVYLEKQHLANKRLKLMRNAYVNRGRSGFIDFSQVAILDEMFYIFNGVLTCVCVCQIFDMLRLIRRVRSFIRMVLSTIGLFYFPVMMGVSFAMLSTLLFGNTSMDFSTLKKSYLTANQYLIKPPVIYYRLHQNHPYLGPYYVLFLGFINMFIVVNFFIVFLSEAYTTIKKQMRMDMYKFRDKTKLEYLFEFLGIQLYRDTEEDRRLMQITADDRSLFAFIKRLRAN
ncbi:hypothetical protein EGW08_000835 [Elysia chlorotica]|uniref:PLAT domain-containing protein n=1 Tax=Elysia chlorotica TaxID=188477 RepID=A0A3S1A0N3_ELYCH|nr:hypothetical protein EGW08_000835 [Elysia chlorotica]